MATDLTEFLDASTARRRRCRVHKAIDGLDTEQVSKLEAARVADHVTNAGIARVLVSWGHEGITEQNVVHWRKGKCTCDVERAA